MEKTFLPQEELVHILEAFKDNQFEQKITTSLDGSYYVLVHAEDSGEMVDVISEYMYDGFTPVYGMELIYTYKVAGYTLVVKQDDEGITIALDNETYCLDTDDETYSELFAYISDLIGDYEEAEAMEYVDWREWTEEELYQVILEDLQYDEYIIEEDFWDDEDEDAGDGEEFFVGEFDPEEFPEPDVKHYTKEEVARILAQRGCPDPCFNF